MLNYGSHRNPKNKVLSTNQKYAKMFRSLERGHKCCKRCGLAQSYISVLFAPLLSGAHGLRKGPLLGGSWDFGLRK